LETLQIRQCASHEDLRTCVRLQRQIWGFQDEDLTPAAIFVVAQHTGGHVLCAFDGDEPVGFTLAFSAEHAGLRYWHSHMAGVLPEYQNRGVGRLLKLRQREEALQGGLSCIKWTFDPLELRNAHFNLARLGGVVREYIPNCYGTRIGPMDLGLPTDRFVCEWWIDSGRVRRALQQAPTEPQGSVLTVPIPSNLSQLKQSDPARVRAIQADLGKQMTELFSRNYSVTGFQRGTETSQYVLERDEI